MVRFQGQRKREVKALSVEEMAIWNWFSDSRIKLQGHAKNFILLEASPPNELRRSKH